MALRPTQARSYTHSQLTLASVGKLRLSRCAISTRTELMVPPLPVILSIAVGCTPSALHTT